MEFLVYIYVYLLGGLTFVPLSLFLGIVTFKWYFPEFDDTKGDESYQNDFLEDVDEKSRTLAAEYQRMKVTEVDENAHSGVNVLRSGWLTVTTEYYVFAQNSVNEKNNEPETNKSAYTSLYKLVKKTSMLGTSEPSDDASGTGDDESNEKAGLNQGAHASSNSNNSSNATATAQKRRKNKYFAVLRHGNLFLYKDESQTDVLHVIVLSNYIVSLWPRDLADGQLFSKMSAICLLKKNLARASMDRMQPIPKDSSASIDFVKKSVTAFDVLQNGEQAPKKSSLFVYCEANCEKEDWYFDLVRATKRSKTGSKEDLLDPNVYADTFHFKTAHMIGLIQNLHSSEGQLHTRWFNAIAGRIFLGLYGTQEFESYIKNKLLQKLQKINRPGFLDEFKIEKVFIGKSAPSLTSPKLTKLNPEGELEVEADIFYNGCISFQVSTKVNINLGTRFKPRDISILLAVTVKQLHGTVVFQIKKPPTERIWWGFKTMPYIDIEVEPVVSARQITTGMVTRTIENKLKDSIKDSLVLPAMDDITFFNTAGEVYRGGVWDKSKRPQTEEQEETTEISTTNDDYYAENNKQDLKLDESLSENANKYESTYEESYRERSQSFASSVITGTDDDEKKSNSFHKAKSNSTVKISQDQFLSDGSFISHKPTDEDKTGKTSSLKKIGKWYFKDKEGAEESPTKFDSNDDLLSEVNSSPKKGPEMISSRRAPRNSSAQKKEKEIIMETLGATRANPINQQPYGKAPEMSFPSLHSPIQFVGQAPAVPPRREKKA